MSHLHERLAYTRTGQGEPLVLLHPLGADRSVWRPVLPYLEPARDVICVDLPGFGASPPLPGPQPPTPERLAAAVVSLLGLLGFGAATESTAHLAGNSLGGWVALEAAVAGHASSVTAIAPAGLWRQPLARRKPPLARKLARAALPVVEPAMQVPALRRLALAGTVARPSRVPPSQAAALIRSYAQAEGFVAVDRAMRARTFRRLAEIRVPVTLAWPEHDRLVARPDSMPANVRESLLAGCGHLPMWDDPQAVADVLITASRATSAR